MGADCENITPYGEDGRDKTQQVQAMFDSIAPAYDWMNRAMTLGLDKLWRRTAVNILRRSPRPINDILDVATGTGDLALEMAARLDPNSVVGIDLSEKMLEIGRRKASASSQGDVVKFETGDCLQLPFPDESFDAVTVAFGVRNFENLALGYSEIARVLRPGGIVLVLELSTPTSKIIRPLYDLYAGKVIPSVGKTVSKDSRAYTYLPESIAAVPQGDEMLALMRGAGLEETECRRLTFGVCSIYTGRRPSDQ